VRVWSTDPEPVHKGEYHIIAGRINDIAWDGDSQRIIAVGEGKERFGHCISWDSGNTVGEISGHSSRINAVDIKKQRPIRAATVSDDASLVFYNGPPFKFSTSVRGKHDRFVFGTQFSPDGASIASVGADRKIWLYDGKTGEPKVQLGEGVHSGSIFGVSWASDSKHLVTASADQTVRVWDVEAGKNTTTWRLGEEGVVNIAHQQLGVTWPSGRSDGLIISVDLDGNLNYLNVGTPKPTKIVQGHQKKITAAAIKGTTFYTGSYEGRVIAWDIANGDSEVVDGDAHTNYVAGLAADPQRDWVYSVGWDDRLRIVSEKTFTGQSASIGGQPSGVAVSKSGTAFVLYPGSVVSFEDGVKTGSTNAAGATSVAAHDELLAIGFEDKSLKLYSTKGVNPEPVSADLQKPTGAISTLCFSPSGNYLAVGTANGKILVFDTSNWKVAIDRWSAHTGRVTTIAWAPNGEHAVSGSLDTSVIVWSVKDHGKRIKALNAHKDGVTGVAWAKTGQVLSAGADATVKVWNVPGL
jgi:WD40 repeat protein